MQDDKAATSYLLMVRYKVVPQEGEADDYAVWTPCFRDLGMEGNEMAQEPASFLDMDEALAEMDNWSKRFPTATYLVMPVISR